MGGKCDYSAYEYVTVGVKQSSIDQYHQNKAQINGKETAGHLEKGAQRVRLEVPSNWMCFSMFVRDKVLNSVTLVIRTNLACNKHCLKWNSTNFSYPTTVCSSALLCQNQGINSYWHVFLKAVSFSVWTALLMKTPAGKSMTDRLNASIWTQQRLMPSY